MLSCPKCLEQFQLLKPRTSELTCCSCKEVWKKKDGVWDFRLSREDSLSLAIYQEPEFLRWIDIFGSQEISNWKIYQTKLNRFFSQAGHRILARKFQREIGKNNQIVEIGAGDGLFYEYIPQKNYIGIDTNWDALVKFAKKHSEATLVCTSGEKLPVASESIDILFSLHTLEHIYYLGEFLEEVKRILRDDGRQYFVIPAEGSYLFYLGRKFVTGPHLRKKYKLDVNYVMDREHINDAKRVLKFLGLYFSSLEKNYWPLPFLRYINTNIMIWGSCKKTRGE